MVGFEHDFVMVVFGIFLAKLWKQVTELITFDHASSDRILCSSAAKAFVSCEAEP